MRMTKDKPAPDAFALRTVTVMTGSTRGLVAAAGFESNGRDIGIIGHLLAGGEMVAAQLPSPSNWSPEKKLAAAVLAGALLEVRDRHADVHYRRRVAEDLTWIASNDTAWPYSFVPLCELFGLEPEYVRDVVKRWMVAPPTHVLRQISTHRHAA